VRPCRVQTVPLHHPQVGELTITQQALSSVASPQQVVVVATVEPDSPSEQTLRMLASLAATEASESAWFTDRV
jgi:hypothetical protein